MRAVQLDGVFVLRFDAAHQSSVRVEELDELIEELVVLWSIDSHGVHTHRRVAVWAHAHNASRLMLHDSSRHAAQPRAASSMLMLRRHPLSLGGCSGLLGAALDFPDQP